MFDCYQGRRVLITGHSGFKGSWLALWLHSLGAEVLGLALDAPSIPSLYQEADIATLLVDRKTDIQNFSAVQAVFAEFQPEIIFHLAAQSLVRPSYANPLETLNTNIMGTAHILETCRQISSVRAALIITSDKCYRNNEWVWGYRENDPMGGHDPYSVSKGCAELVTSAYVNSFFPPEKYNDTHHVAVATARAGNVIGGGDWALDRIVPDCIRAMQQGESVHIRSPYAIRPWQHVLESLNGYLMLAERLFTQGVQYNGGWNFAPLDRADIWNVERVVQKICTLWGSGQYSVDTAPQPHEANLLALDAVKSCLKLGWRPHWNVAEALEATVAWYKAWSQGLDVEGVRALTLHQIEEYSQSSKRKE